ncbi:hypothetical protein [Solitalea koreensis]|uniref:Uncharacterized protein n=1 Tax=Solitalea koreensis TaxID=543615 RepID=A0A521AVI9_9SPHI|nr:hypothetical protein [Solitalea koreensis]SMO38862.1 hypothetical protein SAMN06265350_101469 [Solitalea koreensis]
MQLIPKIIITCVLLMTLVFVNTQSMAQCPMCKTSVESSIKHGGDKGKGLNSGILYLLVMPYFAVAGVGILWYKKYRRKNITIDIPEEKLNLN